MDLRPWAPTRHCSETVPSDRYRHPQPASAVHSTRHCFVITSRSATVMAAPPATDDDHLRLRNALESAPPGLRFEAPAWERQRSSRQLCSPTAGHPSRPAFAPAPEVGLGTARWALVTRGLGAAAAACCTSANTSAWLPPRHRTLTLNVGWPMTLLGAGNSFGGCWQGRECQ